MKKQTFIEKFSNNLTEILRKKDVTALPSIPRCIDILKGCLSIITGDDISPKNLKALERVFNEEIDAATRSGLRGKAAYYSKTTFERIDTTTEAYSGYERKAAKEKTAKPEGVD